MSSPKKKLSNSRSTTQLSPSDRIPKQYSHSILARDASNDQYRQRTLHLIENSVGPVEFNKELETQLKAKDVLIDQLNAKLVAALAASKKTELESKDRSPKELLEDKEKLIQDLSDVQSLYSALVQKHDDLVHHFDTQKDTWEIQVEALTEDNEELRKQLSLRDDSIATSKRDVSEMSAIVTELTRLNSELNGKIAALNEEMERNNNEHYQAVMKMRQTEELERELVESKTSVLAAEQKLESLKSAAAENSDLRHLFHTMTESMVHNLGKIDLSNPENKQAVSALDELLTELSKKSSNLRKQPEAKIAELKQEVAHYKSELVNYKRAVAIALGDKQYHESQVAAVRAEVAKLKHEYDLSVANLHEKGKLIQSSVDYLLKTRKKTEMALEDSKGELSRKNAECHYLSGQVKALKRWEFDVKSTNNELKQALNTLQARFIEVSKSSVEFEQANIALRSELKAALGKNAVLKDELWKRDNKMLRKECKKIKLMEEVSSLKSTIQISYTRYKSVETDEEKAQKTVLPRVERSADVDWTAGKRRSVPEDVLKRLENALKSATSPLVKYHEKGRSVALSVRTLKADLLLHLRSSITTEDVRDYDSLRELFIALSTNSLTVQEVLEEIANTV